MLDHIYLYTPMNGLLHKWKVIYQLKMREIVRDKQHFLRYVNDSLNTDSVLFIYKIKP